MKRFWHIVKNGFEKEERARAFVVYVLMHTRFGRIYIVSLCTIRFRQLQRVSCVHYV